MPKVDFTGVSDKFEPIPDGNYPCAIEEGKWVDEAKSSGEPMVVMTYVITNGEFENRKLFRNYSMQKQSLWAFKRMAVRAGIDPDELSGPIDVDEVIKELTGNEVVVKVGHHEYDGEVRNDVKDVLDPNTATVSV